ncbi:MAG: ornithine cyclodeaminase family protein [Bacteroidetes bacterium]|nr:ornithine cyclodeaminase family protein [Bacteroidota bacterium]
MSDQIFKDIKILSSSDISNLMSMEEAIDAMESAFASYSDGTSHVPQRYVSGIKNLNLFLKPAYNESLGRASVKIIAQKTDGNVEGLPTILGVVLLLDLKTGAILSMMDGACITALRTGAAGGIATKILARNNAATVAIIGCGAQGKTQLEAVCSVREIKRAFLFDIHSAAANNLKTEMEEKLKIPIRVVKDPENLKEADIICTATHSEHPLFGQKHISKGTHINAIGSYKPNMQEVDPAVIKSGRLFVDSRESVLKESGDLIKPINENIFTDAVIESEIGELISKKAEGRQNNHEITIFKSVGLGVQDLFVANGIYEKYLKQKRAE